jgi:two-component system response regulator HydG
VEVRVVAATHRDLAEEMRAGRFRADLYYRLHVLTIRAPSLRERPEDIPLLAAHIVGRSRGRVPEARAVTREALALLQRHSWPGNVRELEAALERAAHALGPGATITAASLDALAHFDPPLVREHREGLRSQSRELEARLIRGALARAGGNRTRAARDLGLTRQGLWKKIRRLSREGADPLPFARAEVDGESPDSP